MTWIKQGVLFHLNPRYPKPYAQVPTPYVFDDYVRVYYSSRLANNKSFISYFDVSRDLKTIIQSHERPIIELGNPGMFDADGMMPSCVIPMGDELWMYYIGWSALAGDARYQNEIGILVSKDNGDTWERKFPGPIMGRSPTEPGLAVMPFVFKDDGILKMYYQSGTGWHLIDGKYEPTYIIKYAQSKNGTKWKRRPEECIPSLFLLQAISRPAVIKRDEHTSMLFCSRGSISYRGGAGSYRIFFSSSADGINFERRNESSLELGKNGEFDSDMQCYPYVFELDGRMIMLYNGNGFGQTGIGYAIWEN